MEKGLKTMFFYSRARTAPKSIKVRLVSSFLVIIFISVTAFEALLIYFTKYYFYNNVESVLTNQIKVASDFYSRYFSNVPLEVNILDNVDVFWKQTAAQVQIVDVSGKILMDSVSGANKELLVSSDFQEALEGKKGQWVGRLDNSSDKVMIISYPMFVNDRVTGALRFITSLREIDRIIFNICLIFISIGLMVILVSAAISLFLANSIVQPLKDVTKAAHLMAGGDLKIRIKKRRNDEIGSLSDTLNYMAEEIENRDAIKNEFISLVSHELRTPLTSIKGWAITLNDKDFYDKAIFHDGLNIIEKESDRLSGMVEELLDFSSFVSGKVVVRKQTINICELTQYIEKYMRPKAIREGIEFQVINSNLPVIEADKDRIKQVLINLLDNAFKFTPTEGKVILEAHADANSIILTVQDTGIGINPEDLPRVKEKFYTGKNTKSNTGLGLSICEEIVKMHQGTIDIESELDRGTIVKVRLPLELNSRGARDHETKV